MYLVYACKQAKKIYIDLQLEITYSAELTDLVVTIPDHELRKQTNMKGKMGSRFIRQRKKKSKTQGKQATTKKT
jgi:hypothetical protein